MSEFVYTGDGNNTLVRYRYENVNTIPLNPKWTAITLVVLIDDAIFGTATWIGLVHGKFVPPFAKRRRPCRHSMPMLNGETV
jgi:hypothetical protein